MDRIVVQVKHDKPKREQVIKVAAYCRVSSGKDAMLHSLSEQVSYFSSYIQRQPGWLYCGVYADEAVTGTKDNRENFLRLVEACRRGEVTMIMTKSISRFARNTVTLLQTVRELKDIGVDVFFEEQNIHTISAEGELMLTILASYAQEESYSMSENMKWRVKKNFEEGLPWNGTMLGYRMENGKYVIIEEQAKIVRSIFDAYISGKGMNAIANDLNASGVPSYRNGKWCKSSVMKVLQNYAYTGNLLLQRFYTNNHIEKVRCVNQGELPMYHVEESHEAIIPASVFCQVQEMIAKKSEKYSHPVASRKYPFTAKIICGNCGKSYRRKVTPSRVVWICSTYNMQGKAACPTSKQIPEETLYEVAAEALGLENFDETAYNAQISLVRAESDNTLVFCFKDGKEVVTRWKDRSRSESWTEEKRKAFSEKRKRKEAI